MHADIKIDNTNCSSGVKYVKMVLVRNIEADYTDDKTMKSDQFRLEQELQFSKEDINLAGKETKDIKLSFKLPC